MNDTKMSEAAIKKLLGTRTPLPGADKPNRPLPKPVETPTKRSGVGALPADPLRNPKAIVEGRLKKAEQGMACGGKVKAYNSGGKVRGCGAATKGMTKGRMR